jgi:hypothetical protein
LMEMRSECPPIILGIAMSNAVAMIFQTRVTGQFARGHELIDSLWFCKRLKGLALPSEWQHEAR